jgi:hypothetical protein
MPLGPVRDRASRRESCRLASLVPPSPRCVAHTTKTLLRFARGRLAIVSARLVIACHGIHWLGPPETDLCAHGGVTIRLGDEVIVDHAERDWNLTVAGLMLLRTLDADHTASGDDDHLVPCCGPMWVADGPADVFVMGCRYGLDWDVRHEADTVALRFSRRPEEVRVSCAAWRDAVVAFCDAVARFHGTTSKAQVHPDDADGVAAFHAEWQRRYAAAHARQA